MGSYYRARRVIVTGGLGFIGSNLAIRLAKLGAQVAIVDSSVPGCGANLHNISPVADSVHVIHQDIADASSFRSCLKHAEVIFNLASEISHTHSMQFPERDLEINVLAHLKFLQECARLAPGIRIVYASTRQVYGEPEYLPVDEKHPTVPVDFNGIHKLAAAGYHLLLSRNGQLDAYVLRLTNVYGPRMAFNAPCQGFLPAFFRKVLQRERIEIFGDGLQLRDPVYVDDVVEAFLLAGRVQGARPRIYNIGGPAALSLRDIGRLVCRTGHVPVPEHRSFPDGLKQIAMGSYQSDCRLAERELNWKPRVFFYEGALKTLDSYAENLSHYLDGSKPCQCKLHYLENTASKAAVA
jgi:nucleoside-diphosphate-sugar epimerase